MSIYKMAASKRIALVAHDNKKKELIEWAIYNKSVLSMHRLFATGTTGKMLEKIQLSDKDPLPHGMTIWRGTLWYSDDVGVICRLKLSQP